MKHPGQVILEQVVDLAVAELVGAVGEMAVVLADILEVAHQDLPTTVAVAVAVLIMLERIRTMKLVLILALELLLLHLIVLLYHGFHHQKIPVQFRLENHTLLI